MSTEVEPTRSFFQRIRSNIHAIEAAEWVALTLILGVLWSAIMMVYAVSEKQWASAIGMACLSPVVLLLALFILWGIYLLYIRIARWGGSLVDVGLWVLMAAITGSVTFWVWIILDVNRWVMSRLFYRGEAPLEYAWSQASKQRRKVWEQARTSPPAVLTANAAMPVGTGAAPAGEQTIKEGPANHWRGAESVGGKLLLTNMRLHFQSHKVNIQTHDVSYPIWEIVSVEKQSTLGVVPNGIVVTLKDGHQERFVVDDRDDWIAKIQQIRSGI
ncbi:MAG: hypothetical protein JXA89_15080 [Anaerolineae bacterium]|nr:hypothetical protein [Anaerolineae bacterium]